MDGEESNGDEPGSASGTLYFVGVTTRQSSIMRLFPRWAEHLGIDARIAGLDLAPGASPAELRSALTHIADDPKAMGALITTHKAAVYDTSRDMFDHLDRYARLCREISCLTVRNGKFAGSAKDPVTAGKAIDWIAHEGAAEPKDVICLGVGGAGVAISVRLLTGPHPVRRLVLVDRDPARIDVARAVNAEIGHTSDVTYLVHAGTGENDRILSDAADGTWVINASGLGKDTPGSPLSPAAEFPHGSVAWDLNYRGKLEFLDLAATQTESRAVRPVDGWRYFLHGWTEVMAEVFGVEMTSALFDELAVIAEDVRNSKDGSDGPPVVSRG